MTTMMFGWGYMQKLNKINEILYIFYLYGRLYTKFYVDLTDSCAKLS